MQSARELDYDESIYNLLHKAECPSVPPQQPRYKSTYSNKVKEDLQKKRQSHRTMGVPEEKVPQPDKFLRKHSKEKNYLERHEMIKMVKEVEPPHERRPPVPRVTEKPDVAQETQKDFISLNASEAVVMKPRKPSLKSSDTRHGDTFFLPKSGLEPVFVHKKNYGKVPNYLEKLKDEREEAREEYQQYLEECRKDGAVQQVSEEERLKLLEGLKKNWDELNSQYQKQSLRIDTVGKIKKKVYLENEMKQLEKDISLLEGHPTMYVL